MTLLATFLDIVADWRPVFPQQRTFQRAVRQALGSLVCLGRRCLSRILWTWGGQNRSWSGEYFLHSRCQWQPQQLLAPILRRALDYCPGRLVGVAVEDTRLPKTGRCIPQAFYQRIPCRLLPCEYPVGIAFPASLLISAAASSRQGRRSRSAHPLGGGFPRQEAGPQGPARGLASLQAGSPASQLVSEIRRADEPPAPDSG